MSYWAAGATIGSAVIGSIGSSKASRRQQEAAAAAQRLKAQKNAEGEQLQQPFYRAGTDALSRLTERLPDLTSGYDPMKLLTTPGYQFGLEQGQKTLEQSLAAHGRSVSGAALKGAARYGTDYSTTKLNDAFNRDRATKRDAFDMLSGVSSMGQRAGEFTAHLGSQYAGSAGQDGTSGADAGAANDMAQGNIWGNLLNQGASTLGRKGPGRVGSGWANNTGFGTGKGYGEEDLGLYLADGGPVRVEPVIGTKGPQRKGSTGGGLSREAILAALDATDVTPRAPAAAPAQRMQPGTIPRVEDALRRSGAYAEGGAVKGKSGGKADKVAAKLSPGEHVIDAEVVAMLGDGNTEAGHALLDELKQRVRAFKRQAPADRPAAAMGA